MKSVMASPVARSRLFTRDLDYVVNGLATGWEQLRNENIFITGGTGFFGTWLVETFCHANDSLGLGATITLLSRNRAAVAAKCPHLVSRSDVRFVAGDVRSFKFPSGCYRFVIHGGNDVAAVSDAARLELFETIVGGTRRVLEFVAQAGTQKILLISSGAVYGCQPTEISGLAEDYRGAPDPLLATSAYGEAKRVAEHLVATHSAQSGCAAKIARCFAFVGPHLPLDSHFAIGNFIRDALAGGPVRVIGGQRAWRSYLYASDLSLWLWTILFQGAPGTAYNVGSPDGRPLVEIAREVALALCGSPDVQVDLPPGGEQREDRYVPLVDRIVREFNPPEPIALRESIVRTAEWHKRNRE